MTEIREITPTLTYAVRQPVLRPGKSIETCRFDGDDLSSTTHFGLFEGDNLAGVASLFDNRHPGFSEFKQFQLRGMAVLEEYQGNGFGFALVEYAEDRVRRAGGDLVWFNAREKAVGFYENSGYKITGRPFNIGDIGTHYVMFKRI
jgi:GNAT superfamily N-acetyltransferase